MKQFFLSISQNQITPPPFINLMDMGQSNDSGRDGDTTNPEYPFTSSVNKYITPSGTIEALTTLSGPDTTDGSHRNYLGEKYISLLPASFINVGNVSKGGSGLTETSQASNNWSATGNLRPQVETRQAQCITLTGEGFGFGTWIQGERDAQEMDSNSAYTPAIVRQAMIDVIDWWNTLSGNKPFLICELGDFSDGRNDQGWQDMRAIQNEMVTLYPNVYMAFTGAKNFWNEGKMIDSLHYTFTGYKEIGEAFAIEIYKIIASQ